MRTTTSWSKLFETCAETCPPPGERSGPATGTIPETRATMNRMTAATTAPNIRFIGASISDFSGGGRIEKVADDSYLPKNAMRELEECRRAVGRDEENTDTLR